MKCIFLILLIFAGCGKETKKGSSISQYIDNIMTNHGMTDAEGYYYENGTLVPVGAPLHRHENNVVMTGLTMGPNERRVSLTPPNTNTTMTRTTNTNTTAGRNMSGMNRNGGNGGNGRSGNGGAGNTGGMGGY